MALSRMARLQSGFVLTVVFLFSWFFRERQKHWWERDISWLPSAHSPLESESTTWACWPRIKPVTFWCMLSTFNHWATPGQAQQCFDTASLVCIAVSELVLRTVSSPRANHWWHIPSTVSLLNTGLLPPNFHWSSWDQYYQGEMVKTVGSGGRLSSHLWDFG